MNEQLRDQVASLWPYMKTEERERWCREVAQKESGSADGWKEVEKDVAQRAEKITR